MQDDRFSLLPQTSSQNTSRSLQLVRCGGFVIALEIPLRETHAICLKKLLSFVRKIPVTEDSFIIYKITTF